MTTRSMIDWHHQKWLIAKLGVIDYKNENFIHSGLSNTSIINMIKRDKTLFIYGTNI